MPFRPTDGGNIVPDEQIKALEQGTKPPEKPESGSEPSEETPEAPLKDESGVPFHENPQVQAYIERQVQKRVGEGNKAWEERIARLESRLTATPRQNADGEWKPKSEQQATVVKAIIAQAKREMIDDLQEADKQNRAEVERADREFSEWLGELRTLGQLKSDEDEQELARLIVEYKLEDKEAAIKLFNTIREKSGEASEQGKIEGIKKAQEAKVGSGRKVGEPGAKEKTYQQRMSEERTFDDIVTREVNRLREQ